MPVNNEDFVILFRLYSGNASIGFKLFCKCLLQAIFSFGLALEVKASLFVILPIENATAIAFKLFLVAPYFFPGSQDL